MKGVKLSTCYLFLFFLPASSQSALNMVSRCMAVDLEHDGILCMAIHPGWVQTDMGGAEVRSSLQLKEKNALQMIFYQSSSAVTLSCVHIRVVRV